MDDLLLCLKNEKINPLIRSCVFHYELEFIHPFQDGNGRVGRFWHTLLLYNYLQLFKTTATATATANRDLKQAVDSNFLTKIGEKVLTLYRYR